MRIVIQRAKGANVVIEGKCVAEFQGLGYLILLGIEATDTMEDVDWLVRKVAALRIFDDENGVMNRSIIDIQGEHEGADGNIIVVSQFTLYASYKKGNRPSWLRAAPHEISVPLYEAFVAQLCRAIGRPVGHGEFGADMKVSLTNDGPVTICMDSKNKE
ncbi:MAG: D-tyrosyl-tRNA(Tyr) deacylase [Bacteroidales bacterium]|nr:D-tyrosyl-tRNA(Tyr) deacylase [Bacteroidales bacterium]